MPQDTSGLTLVEPSRELMHSFLDMVGDFVQAGETGRSRLRVVEDTFAGFVEGLRREAQGAGLSEGHVPQTTYWLLLENGAIVGTARLRHRLTPDLEIWGGHIGYEIRPSERRKGYGTALLRLTLEKARERGLERVLLTCHDDNVGSARVIENNRGRLADVVREPESGKPARRYWISLESAEASLASARGIDTCPRPH